MKTSLILGASGMIGHHLSAYLQSKGHTVIGADRFPLQYDLPAPDQFYQVDLTDYNSMHTVVSSGVDEIYHLAAEMGGAGYVFTGNNDADILTNSLTVTLNLVKAAEAVNVKDIFFTSSACAYPEYNQLDPDVNTCIEDSAYPADPDSEYGWEKLTSERIFLAHNRNKGFRVRIARLHNVFGPHCSWDNGREKSPAALCRKVALAAEGDTIEIWGSGKQTRTFLYIDQAIEGIYRIMNSDADQPLNLGATTPININGLALLIAEVAGKTVYLENIPGPLGVVGRKSDNSLIEETIGWKPTEDLRSELEVLYKWVAGQIEAGIADKRPG